MKFVEEQPLAPAGRNPEDAPASLRLSPLPHRGGSAPLIAAAFATGLLLRSSTARAAAGSLVSVAATLAKPVLLTAGLIKLGHILSSMPARPAKVGNEPIL